MAQPTESREHLPVTTFGPTDIDALLDLPEEPANADHQANQSREPFRVNGKQWKLVNKLFAEDIDEVKGQIRWDELEQVSPTSLA